MVTTMGSRKARSGKVTGAVSVAAVRNPPNVFCFCSWKRHVVRRSRPSTGNCGAVQRARPACPALAPAGPGREDGPPGARPQARAIGARCPERPVRAASAGGPVGPPARRKTEPARAGAPHEGASGAFASSGPTRLHGVAGDEPGQRRARHDVVVRNEDIAPGLPVRVGRRVCVSDPCQRRTGFFPGRWGRSSRCGPLPRRSASRSLSRSRSRVRRRLRHGCGSENHLVPASSIGAPMARRGRLARRTVAPDRTGTAAADSSTGRTRRTHAGGCR